MGTQVKYTNAEAGLVQTESNIFQASCARRQCRGRSVGDPRYLGQALKSRVWHRSPRVRFSPAVPEGVPRGSSTFDKKLRFSFSRSQAETLILSRFTVLLSPAVPHNFSSWMATCGIVK